MVVLFEWCLYYKLIIPHLMRHCVIIGSGIGGLAVAAQLAHKGYHVTVLEKNAQPGGRAGVFSVDGLRFDMGPSWYLMPEVFERFFRDLGENINDYLTLEKLSPAYRVYFEGSDAPIDIYSDLKKDAATFEALEPGSTPKLKTYLARSKAQYQLILDNFLYAHYDSPRALLKLSVLKAAKAIPVFGTMQRYVSTYFKSDEIQKLLQYSLVFLGSSPYNAPALYNMMSHVEYTQGVFYPKHGIYEIVNSLLKLCEKYGVALRYSAPVAEILVKNGRATGVRLEDGTEIAADVVVSNADIHFTETKLLPATARQHSEKYWERRVLAPSALLMYLGVRGELPTLQHHTLYFAKDWRKNFADIFDTPTWPENPSLYISNPSKTDPTVAPARTQNMFVLVPIGARVSDTPKAREAYAESVLDRIAKIINVPDLKERITYKQLFGPSDFTERYNSYGGTALGLAHTFSQTAFWRPKSRSPKVANLYYVGANVHPGIGMPVCLISAHIASQRISKDYPC